MQTLSAQDQSSSDSMSILLWLMELIGRMTLGTREVGKHSLQVVPSTTICFAPGGVERSPPFHKRLQSIDLHQIHVEL